MAIIAIFLLKLGLLRVSYRLSLPEAFSRDPTVKPHHRRTVIAAAVPVVPVDDLDVGEASAILASQ